MAASVLSSESTTRLSEGKGISENAVQLVKRIHSKAFTQIQILKCNIQFTREQITELELVLTFSQVTVFYSVRRSLKNEGKVKITSDKREQVSCQPTCAVRNDNGNF